MDEKVFKASGRKENVVFKNCRSQEYYVYDGHGQQVRKTDNTFKQKLDEGNVDGLGWTWITQVDNASMTTTSKEVISSYIRFKWTNLEGVLGFTGGVDFKLKKGETVVAYRHVDALVEFSGQWVGIRNLEVINDVQPNAPDNNYQNRQNMFGRPGQRAQEQNILSIEFSFAMTPIFEFPIATDILSNFAQTDITDVVLDVQGEHLHVNKSFLSIHSEFFDRLFNSDFKEKSQPVIPINDVEFTDFSNFLSLIYPNPAEITVEKVSKYLELAGQYLMAVVTRQCEEFLLRNNRVKKIQKIVFADKYALNKLLRETLASLEAKEELEALTLLPEFSTLSDSTKAAMLHKFMHFIN